MVERATVVKPVAPLDQNEEAAANARTAAKASAAEAKAAAAEAKTAEAEAKAAEAGAKAAAVASKTAATASKAAEAEAKAVGPSVHTRVVEGILLIYSFVIGTGINELWAGKGPPHDFALYLIALCWLIAFAVGARVHLDKEFIRATSSRKWLVLDLAFVVAFGITIKAATISGDIKNFFFFGAGLFGLAVCWFVACLVFGRERATRNDGVTSYG